MEIFLLFKDVNDLTEKFFTLQSREGPDRYFALFRDLKDLTDIFLLFRDVKDQIEIFYSSET